MSSVLNFAGIVAKTTAIVAAVTVVAAGTFAAITKPKNATLKEDLETSMTSTSDNILDRAIDLAAAKLTTKTSKTNVKDYVFFKTADVQFADGSKQTFIGAFQNWFPINEIDI